MRTWINSRKPVFLLILFIAYILCVVKFAPSMAAPRGVEDQFAATLIVHIAGLMPKNIQQLFVRYEKNLWEGYRFEQGLILQTQNVSDFNCLKEIDEKQATLIKWLQNYREGAGSPDFKLTRKMDRIVEEHGRLIRNIEQYYRDNVPSTDNLITKLSNSTITVTYKGYNAGEVSNISSIIQKDIAGLRKKSAIQVGDFYQTLLTSCTNSILYIHLKAGLKVDLASLSNQTIKIDNVLKMSPPPNAGVSGYLGTICDGLYGLCMAMCRGSSCSDQCGGGYSECLDAASGVSPDEYY